MSISRRKVYYIHGFDQRGVKHYRSLYEIQLKKQLTHTNYDAEIVNVPEKKNQEKSQENNQWKILFSDKESKHTTTTDYLFMSWVHVLKPYTSISSLHFFYKSVIGFFWYIKTSFLKKSWTEGRLFFTSMIISYIGVLAPVFSSALFISLYLLGIAPVFFCLIAVSLSVAVSWWLNKFFNTFWLVRAYNFSKIFSQNPDLLMPQLREFAKLIKADINKNNADEYMIIGHCYGSALLAPILNEIQKEMPAFSSKISVLSLAQTSPILLWTSSWYKVLVKEINYEAIDFIDYSSPADGVCFPSFYFKTENKESENYISKSPRFHKLFSPENYKKRIRKNKFRIHFQYLMASEKSDFYDFFDITSGSKKLIDYAKSR